MAFNSTRLLRGSISVLCKLRISLLSPYTNPMKVALFAVCGVSGITAAQVGLILTYTSMSLIVLYQRNPNLWIHSFADASLWYAYEADGGSRSKL